MTTVQDILTFMEGLAPYELAESWDNVGLLCGDRAQEVTSVLCALDVTETVVQEAAERGVQLVVAHHPAIFTSVSRVTSDDTTGRVLRYACIPTQTVRRAVSMTHSRPRCSSPTW